MKIIELGRQSKTYEVSDGLSSCPGSWALLQPRAPPSDFLAEVNWPLFRCILEKAITIRNLEKENDG